MANPLPTDTVLVAGLNDVKTLSRFPSGPGRDITAIAESVSAEILNRIKLLCKRILEHSAKYGVDDTFTVATVIHVPAIYWLATYGDYPAPDYSNLKKVVDRTNQKIEEFNFLIDLWCAPKVHLIGERSLNRGRVYLWEAFREEDKALIDDAPEGQLQVQVDALADEVLREGDC